MKNTIMAVVLFVSMLLTGCQAMTGYIHEATVIGAAAADKAREAAEFELCKAMTIGAWMRAYAADAKKAEAWRVLCSAPIMNIPKQ